ncbi:glycosyltransferase [Xanthobacteraceae bacterium A53D]
MHARQPLSTPVTAFSGPADVAIVNLNPDGWEVFPTAEQREVIRTARHCIGQFVWEMTAAPRTWTNRMRPLDAIWTPSTFCATTLGEWYDCPVHVIPHVVPVTPPPAAGCLPDMVPAGRRSILYVFDGASMLARKRPMALVQGFEASGLADHGWQLVLKTKNLQDSGKRSTALMAAAAANPAITLLTTTLRDDMMAALRHAADIYASPHCAEGFGLTIAEAMALGKAVVATDYGGSRDFLDETCGYPVPFREVALAEEAGPYPQGGVWAEVDVPALAQALKRAAAAVEAGDTALGERARTRIAAGFSTDAIATRMSASLAGIATPDGRP